MAYGFTGPNLRAAGVDYDVRVAHPYSSYEDFDFIVPVGKSGDTYDRFCVRNAEVWESISIIKQALAKNYKGFEVNVTLGQLRAITVYVVGQARRPGSYTLSSMSTLSSGLFASGGPNANGSVRRVQLKRAGQLVTEFDL